MMLDIFQLVVNGVMRHAEVRTERVVVTGRFHGSVEASFLEVRGDGISFEKAA